MWFLLKCIWQTFLICSIKSPRCTDKNSKTNISIAICLPGVLIYQKRQISLPVRTKPRDQKQETGSECDVISGLEALRKTDFSVIFWLWANKFAKKWYKSALFIRKCRRNLSYVTCHIHFEYIKGIFGAQHCEKKWPAVHRIAEWRTQLFATCIFLCTDGLISLSTIHCLFLLSKYFFHLGCPIVHLGVIELGRRVQYEGD